MTLYCTQETFLASTPACTITDTEHFPRRRLQVTTATSMAVETLTEGLLKKEKPETLSDSEENIDVTDNFDVDEPMELEESREVSAQVCSPSSLGKAPSPSTGSPSPQPELDHNNDHHHHHQDNNGGVEEAPPAARVSNFRIEDILKPEFGAKTTKVSRPVTSCTWRPFEDFKPRNYLPQDIDYKPSIHPAHRLGFPPTNGHHHVPTYELDHRRRCNSTASVSSTDSSPLSSPKTKSPVARLPDLEGIGKSKSEGHGQGPSGEKLWPAWVYCTRYSDRPSSGRRKSRTIFITFFFLTVTAIHKCIDHIPIQ